MSTVSFQISNLLEKMTSSDKDFRFMATNDLMAELQKDSIKLDDDGEKKIVKMLLKLLEDKNGEVQNLAVKCLGPLVNKVKEHQVEIIVDTLCTNMVSEKEQLRDISSIGLKTVISELPQSSTGLAANVSKKITGKLTSTIAMQQQKDVTVQLEALDILSDLLNRFGNLLVSFHPTIQEALIPQLSSQRLAVRKRSITAISYLVMSCNQTLFAKIIDILLEKLVENQKLKNSNVSVVRTYIQCVSAITRQAGHRFGKHLEKVVPLIAQFSEYEDDELKEYCIQAFESFVRRCPKEITPHVQLIIQICLKYICYDPNYNYDDASVEEMEMDNSDSSESNEEYSDDDDMSWKVRRAAAKCLEAVIATRHDMVVEFYKTVSPVLIIRFKEREENVKVDIFHAYNALLKQTRPTHTDAEDAGNPIALLESQVPNIVKALHKQLREKSIKTRQGSFGVLNELINVLPGCLKEHSESLIPGILYSLGDKNSSSNMKIDALIFLNSLLKRHPPEIFHPHIQVLLPAVISAVEDSFYKISSEALLVLTQMVRIIRPLETPSTFKYDGYLQIIYTCTFSKLKASDIDQEVKERAITCMGQIISSFGDSMVAEVAVTLPVLVDRLRNEITRLTCVKALTKIAGSQFKLEIGALRSFLAEAIPILASFLRKNQRTLKLSTLILLDTLVKNYGEQFTVELISIILQEVPPLINESDLHISQLTLSLLTSLTRSHQAFLSIIPQKILPETLVLVRSPLLQGAALQSVLDFLQALVRSSFPGLDYMELVRQLTIPVSISNQNMGPSLHKQAYHSIAKCVAAITTLEKEQSLQTVRRYINDIKNPPSDVAHLFALLTIGEIGKNVDLTSITELKELIIESFLSSSEEVKSAASFALGSISVGNLKEYLPFVLQQIATRDKRQYLLLHSLKEIISCQSINPAMVQALEPHLDSIWSLLFNHCECPEEGTRNVVAECLGKLTLMNPRLLLPRLQTYLKHPSPLARSTVVTAMKFTISDQPQAIDHLLRNCIGDFLRTLQDEDINVRRVALVAFNSAAHNKPSLIRDLLDTILPQLYNETKVRGELIREVEMGPFKHTVDDGLDIRKAAFECMYTLLDSCLDRIDIFEFLNHVEDGLRDHYDVKMLTYLMLVRLSHLCPSAVLNRIERLVEPLKVTCSNKVKTTAVKQEFEKQDELKRSAMRALLALLGIPDADKNPKVMDFLNHIKTTPDLQVLFEQIQKDASSVNETSSPMETN
ncbi:Cullin-associated NEDD8-dissociated protein 1-like protein [Dinothrombium tinctorium]|uniref:Cullin-associated NEDD8-dissociated protein 1-like protein n=1 Tax=Dinothrombium tinctorium TaxID=1965070 RepID=A0A3S3Q885_9ACAR|nr:Cullin-associated NEDD8-dissociated protein 1-like protein [Dinothrombium tinctorium]RWS15710.1 Cullin-associated NEDD8-dissociated protein 1-like protein [Dinothrombium tinctorium]